MFLFLHIGEDIVIPLKDIVGIFDIKIRENNSTKEFLQIASEEGFVKEKSDEEKSFVLTSENVYFSSISSATLRKRLDNIYHEVESEVEVDQS